MGYSDKWRVGGVDSKVKIASNIGVMTFYDWEVIFFGKVCDMAVFCGSGENYFAGV